MSNPIVVTGAAGFIGRNVVAELNARGYDNILLVDQLGTDDKWRNLVGLRFEDILSPEAFLAQVDAGTAPTPQAIIHLGACSATTERDADFLLRNNYAYSRTLCEWCLRHGIRFVCASSAATYGDGAQGYSDADPVTPTLRPLNMYGYSKHLFDLWALKHGLFGESNGIVALKYFNVYGPYEDHKGDMMSVVAKSWHQIRETGKVRLFKSYRPDYRDGEQMRDFLYVKDAVAMTLFFALESSTGGLFNCGSGTPRTWKDLATATFRAMNLPVNIEFIEMPEALRGKYQYFTKADISKARTTGFTAPMHTLEEGVTDYIRNYFSHIAPSL